MRVVWVGWCGPPPIPPNLTYPYLYVILSPFSTSADDPRRARDSERWGIGWQESPIWKVRWLQQPLEVTPFISVLIITLLLTITMRRKVLHSFFWMCAFVVCFYVWNDRFCCWGWWGLVKPLWGLLYLPIY